MALKLTDRQRLLVKRLVKLGDMANANDLPIRPTEIRGFGSFFRGKPRPHDVDLLIKARTDGLTEFACFIQFLDAIRYDLEFDERFSTPKDVMSQLVAMNDPRAALISGCSLQRLLRWISPYSWNMLRPKGLCADSEFESPINYAQRMIKAELPNINVLAFMGPSEGDKRVGMRCGFTVRVWSTEYPDTKANLDELMTEESLRRNALLERSYFLTQVPGITASVRYREAEIALLKQIPTQQPSSRDAWGWFDDFSKGHPDLAEAALQLDRTRSISKNAEENDVHDDGSPLLKLADEVDQLRKELKYLYTRNEHLESLRNKLAYFRSGAKNYGLSVDEFAVYEMLNRGSKAAKLKCKEFLESMGYPVDEIVARLAR